jgi:hypothetical protein
MRWIRSPLHLAKVLIKCRNRVVPVKWGDSPGFIVVTKGRILAVTPVP